MVLLGGLQRVKYLCELTVPLPPEHDHFLLNTVIYQLIALNQIPSWKMLMDLPMICAGRLDMDFYGTSLTWDTQLRAYALKCNRHAERKSSTRPLAQEPRGRTYLEVLMVRPILIAQIMHIIEVVGELGG